MAQKNAHWSSCRNASRSSLFTLRRALQGCARRQEPSTSLAPHEAVGEAHESVQETNEAVDEAHESVQEAHESVLHEAHESVQEAHESVLHEAVDGSLAAIWHM
jgi:hypothetical protein